MAIPNTPGDLERGKFREVSGALGTIAVAVTNPDGSTISGGGGGGGNVNLNEVGGAAYALGQTTKSASMPVTVASDQGALGTVGTTSAVVNVGQQTVNTTAVQISSSSTVPANGILIEALSTNAASIFIGGSGVTTSTGYEIQPGATVPFTCNLNTLYIISVASTTDNICWNVT